MNLPTYVLCGLLVLSFGCSSPQASLGSPLDPTLPGSVILPIPDHPQELGAPPEGWCAEASLQMGLSYYKHEISQKDIHNVANPVHPDLESAAEIDGAMKALGMDYRIWDSKIHKVDRYIAWIKSNLAQGYPVFSGVKLNPTQHPEWAADHFVLIVGYNDDGLFVNTNHFGVGQLLIPYQALVSQAARYSLENPYHYYFGRALTGVSSDGNGKSIVLPSAVSLHIPDRFQESPAPEVEWSAEASILMGLAYYDKAASQVAIHAAGESSSPSLESDNVDFALFKTGLNYTAWDKRDRDLSQFITWIKFNLARKYPVLCGIKRNPSVHPERSVDEFVLITGYDEKGLYLNSTHAGEGHIQVNYGDLASNSSRYSIENPFFTYFGRALTGAEHPPPEQTILVQASATARDWLALTDDFQAVSSWEAAADSFKDISSGEWGNLLKRYRVPYGHVRNRGNKTATWTRDYPGHPGEEIVVMEFTTEFENNLSAIETVKVTHQAGGSWKVFAYYIKPAAPHP